MAAYSDFIRSREEDVRMIRETSSDARRPSEDTLRSIARLYDLVAEMNAVTLALKLANVKVYFGGRGSQRDPLAQQAIVSIEMDTGADTLHV